MIEKKAEKKLENDLQWTKIIKQKGKIVIKSTLPCNLTLLEEMVMKLNFILPKLSTIRNVR